MKIAVVAPLVTPIAEPQLGGSQALLADIAQGLTARGHDVGVYASSGSHIDGVRVIDTGIDAVALRPTLYRAGGADEVPSDLAAEAFSRVYELLREGSWDVVHNHAFDAPAIELGPAELPVVHTLHLPPQRSIADALDRARSSGASVTVVCVSASSGRGWETLTGVDLVIRNGVPVDQIPFSGTADGPALFAGRFSPEKGAAEAIEIARTAGVAIILVGSAYDETYAAECIEPYRGAAGVEILDAVVRAQLWALMASSRAVLCPVRWEEPFGLVAAEAQAAGTPVIAFARGASPEVIADGKTGALVADVASGAEALRTVGRFDRTACRAHAERNLTLTDTIDAYEALYTRLVPAAAGSR